MAEIERWRELWESPQATQWDDTARGTVAVLVTYESEIFAGTASAWQAQESRYAADALGLAPRALAQLGWRIVDEEPTCRAGEPAPGTGPSVDG